ncbi:formate dehydrogenase accessory sulfurtransferase FdhD [Streptomyces sp. NPDC057702]|uniref:formate dehydrogenase accessory sulfurtransferase FdhD n=1 Tax=unclassified Streptomyces TaxID=2593676 RepID=UPI0036994F45
MGRVTERRRVVRIRNGKVSTRPDTLVAEEPLEIRLNGKPLAITMRTPGDDFALATGFLVSEGVLALGEELATIAYCAGAVAPFEETDDDGAPLAWAPVPVVAGAGLSGGGGRGGGALPVARGAAGARGANTYNVVDVHLAPGVPLPDMTLERNVYTTSSCGLCGKASLDAVRTTARWPVGDPATPVTLSPDVLAALPDRLRAAQRVFDRTGGLHAAALFTAEGELVDVREDVGRHNAVDKLVGRALQQGRLPLSSSVLLVSGRASFELAQKAVMAGIPVLAAVSAPSSLAVDLAEETGLTLIGFLRGADMNVYAGTERVAWEE